MDSENRRQQINDFSHDVRPEDNAEQHGPVPPGAGAKRDPPKPFHRLGNWGVGLIALALLSISAYGFFYHREKLAAISAEHLRLFVTGPSVIQAGVAADFTIFTASLEGRPLSAEVEATLSGTAGQPMKAYHAVTDERGRLQFTIPAELQLPAETRLVVTAWQRNSRDRETAETAIAVVPMQLETYVTLDKLQYRPGETVHYRVLTLSRFRLTADRVLAVQFEIFDSAGVAVPKSLRKATTDRGVAGGDFALPDRLPEGRYTLAVRGDGRAFPPQRQAFWVRRAKSPDSEKTAGAGANASAAKTVAQSAASGSDDDINVTFYPEGGGLAADVENRVYFVARTLAGRPAAISGEIVGRGDGDRVAAVATVQTTCDGRGAFSFVPRAGAAYRLKISDPAGVETEPVLSDVAEDEGATINAGSGVFAAGTPLEFLVCTRKAGMPLVAAAYCRGVQVGEQMFETKGGEAIDNPIELDLDEAVGGVVRLAVYNYSSSPPKLVAERLVYRQAAQKLNVQTVENEKRPTNGNVGKFTFSVTDENGEPTPAVLSVAVAENAATSDAPSASTFFLLTDDLDKRERLKDADFYLSDQTRGKTPAAAALDLLLGTQGRRAAASPPPLVYDNLRLLRADYDQCLADYRADRPPMLNTLIAASFFGGLGLVLLTAMANLLRIVSSAAWIPALVAMICCLTVGSILMSPDRQTAGPNTAAAFFSYHASQPSPKEETHVPPLPESADESPEHSAGKTLLWKPGITADADGRATISIEPSDAALSVTIDAHDAGRFGSARLIVPATKSGK